MYTFSQEIMLNNYIFIRLFNDRKKFNITYPIYILIINKSLRKRISFLKMSIYF